MASYIESRADRFADVRAVVRADLRADEFVEKIAPTQIHLQKFLQTPMQKQMSGATKKLHRDYNCVKMIQINSDKVQNGTDAESRAELFAETCAGEIKKCADAGTVQIRMQKAVQFCVQLLVQRHLQKSVQK